MLFHHGGDIMRALPVSPSLLTGHVQIFKFYKGHLFSHFLSKKKENKRLDFSISTCDLTKSALLVLSFPYFINRATGMEIGFLKIKMVIKKQIFIIGLNLDHIDHCAVGSDRFDPKWWFKVVPLWPVWGIFVQN